MTIIVNSKKHMIANIMNPIKQSFLSIEFTDSL